MTEIIGLLILAVVMQFGLRWYVKTESGKHVDAKIKAKANLPQWARIAENIILFISFFSVLFILWNIVEIGWFAFYPSAVTLGFNHYSRSIMLITVALATLPLCGLVANVVLWVIKPLRLVEIENFKDIPNATFREENMRLLKMALILEPVCLLLAIVGLLIK